MDGRFTDIHTPFNSVLKYTFEQIKKMHSLSGHYDRPSVGNIGWMALRSGRHDPLYFSCESGIVKPEILQEENIRLTFQH